MTSLNLCATEITNNSLTSIIEYLDQTLEELGVSATKVYFGDLFNLKLMAKLRLLNCSVFDTDRIETLKTKVPNLQTVNSPG